VRRAAASAFQEAVGRLGGALQHGLDLLGAVDCYSVANMGAAFLRAAPQVAAFPEHRGPLLSHLLSAKLRHWDKPTRALAARALAALAPSAGPDWVAARALPVLLARVTDDALETRCGAVLGVAELLPALAAAGVTDLNAIDRSTNGGDDEGLGATTTTASGTGTYLKSAGKQPQQQQQQGSGEDLAARVAAVLGVLESAKLYRGKGGELMREAAARLVDCTAQAVSGLRRGGSSGGGSGSRPGSGGADSPVVHASDGDNAEAAAGGSHEDGVALDPVTGSATHGHMRLHASAAPLLSLPLGVDYHTAALALIEDCLCHPLAGIRASGAAALASHARAHCSCAEAAGLLHALVDRCLARLTDPNVAHR